MAWRITKEMLNKKLALICTLLNKPFGQFKKADNERSWDWNIGGYFLDNCSGYTVREIHENGAESSPFGNNRLTAKEMYYMLEGIWNALYIKSKEV